MKSFFKKIALVLVLAMVVTMLPAKAVSAADAEGPQLSKQVKLYIGGDKSGSYSESAYAKVWNKDGYTVEFSSSDETVATVGKRKGLVTAVSVGEATITAVFTNEDGETVTKTCPVLVKKNAVVAGISENSQKTLLEGITVGETFQPKVFRTSADGETSWKGKDVITDGARFTSSNVEVFTVAKTTGKITAVGAGEATLTVWAVQGEKPAEVDENGKVVEYLATTEKVEYPVVVKAGEAVVTGVTVKSVTDLELAVSGVTAENVGTLKITNVNGGDITSLFSTPVLSEDGKTVAVKKYFNLINDEELTFAFGEGEGFTYTVKVGEPVAIVIDGPATAIVGVETDISYRVVDANGIDLGVTSGVSFKVNDNTYTTLNGAKITMWQVGKNVTLTATYDTGKWDENWNAIVFETEIVVNCIEASAVTANGVTFMVGTDLDGGKLSAEPASMFANVYDNKLFVEIALSDNNKVNSKDYAGRFTFEALTPSVLLVEANTGYLTPVTTGTARILVKYNDGVGLSTTGVATINVKPAPSVESISVDKNGVSLSNSAQIDDSVVINIKGTNQYGDEIGLDASKITKQSLARPNGVDVTTAENHLVISGTVATFSASNVTAGTYTYRVTYDNSKSVIVSVTVREPVKDSAGEYVVSSYKVLVTGNVTEKEIKPADLNAGNVTDSTQISFKIVGVDRNGVAATVETDATKLGEVKVKAGDTEAQLENTFATNGEFVAKFVTTSTAEAVSGSAALVIGDTGYDVKTGTFVISATYNGRTVVPANVAVSLKDVTAPTIKVNSSVVTGATKETYKNLILAQIELNNNGKTYLAPMMGDIVSPIESTDNPLGTSYVLVKSIKVYEKVGDNYVLHTVAVNRYFSVTIQ